MENSTTNATNAAHLLRLVGFFAIAIGAAWAIQTLGFGHETVGARIMWVIAAASMSGAGAGLLVASGGLQDEPKPVRA